MTDPMEYWKVLEVRPVDGYGIYEIDVLEEGVTRHTFRGEDGGPYVTEGGFWSGPMLTGMINKDILRCVLWNVKIRDTEIG